MFLLNKKVLKFEKKKGFKNDVFKYIYNKILHLYTKNIYNYQQKNSQILKKTIMKQSNQYYWRF